MHERVRDTARGPLERGKFSGAAFMEASPSLRAYYLMHTISKEPTDQDCQRSRYENRRAERLNHPQLFGRRLGV
jgi:hypothetical protein